MTTTTTAKPTHSGIAEGEGRAAIVAEARRWLGTPYHVAGRVRGVGCDCGTLIAEVYAAAGIIPRMAIAPYPADWHKHRKDEQYLAYILQHGREIARGTQQPGDVAMWKFGHVRSHGAIIVGWPRVIHATLRERTVWECDVAADVRYGADGVTFYSAW